MMQARNRPSQTPIGRNHSSNNNGILPNDNDGCNDKHKNGKIIGGHNNKYSRLAPYRITIMVVVITVVSLFVPIVVKKTTSTTGSKNSDNRHVILRGTSSSNSIDIKQSNNNHKKIILPSGFDSIYNRAIEMSQKCQQLYLDDIQPSKQQQQQQKQLFPGFDTRSELPFLNDTLASLPSFGIIETLEQYFSSGGKTTKRSSSSSRRQQQRPQNNDISPQQCIVPPPTECNETQFTVVFMAYNPDRLGKTLTQIKTMLKPPYSLLVYEIVLVWNGPRDVNESISGNDLLQYAKDHPVRIVYPLKMGYPNDLMNRYEPSVLQLNATKQYSNTNKKNSNKNTVAAHAAKAILYYDDDGPFYSYDAIRGGFELWKRHSNVQIGAMSREITYSIRQQKEWNQLTNNSQNLTDKQFLSHCVYQINSTSTNTTTSTKITNDQVDYNYRYFANYNANMVLPSGSFLHSFYLCYICHPVFDEIRTFVQNHPVHPDDMTVSMIVSQISGSAPRVYSRSLEKPKPSQQQQRRRRKLQEQQQQQQLAVTNDIVDDMMTLSNTNHMNQIVNTSDNDYHSNRTAITSTTWIQKQQQQQHSSSSRRRKLMFSINWDAGSGMTDMKQYWADLRIEAINSLVRYFGSINSGSIGWCENTIYFDNTKREGKCNPIMARQGYLPWMNLDNTPKQTCP